MAEKTMSEILDRIKLLYDQFFVLDDNVNDAFKAGLSVGGMVWTDTTAPDIRRDLRKMSELFGKDGLMNAEIRDYVESDTITQLANEHRRLQAKFDEMSRRWTDTPEASIILTGISYYKDAPIGSFIYNKTKESLKKLKESDETIDKIKVIVNDIESIRAKIPTTSDFWIEYDKMIAKLKEAEYMRKLIPIYPTASDYESYGLANPIIVFTPGVILALAIGIAILASTVAAIALLAYAIVAAKEAVVARLDKTEKEKEEVEMLAVDTAAKAERGDKLSDKEKKLALDAINLKVETDLKDAKTAEEVDKISAMANATLDSISTQKPLSSEQSLYLNSAITAMANARKEELNKKADNWIDKIMAWLKTTRDTLLIGGGIVAGVVVLAIVLPKILRRSPAPAPAPIIIKT